MAAFGDGTLYVERLIDRPRHVEIQVFADDHGNVVHLFERECSVQRRHQKVIEESPSPAVSLTCVAAWVKPPSPQRAPPAIATRARLSSSSKAPATNAALLLSGDEHPAAGRASRSPKAVTGVDLVRAQLIVAAGGQPALGTGRAHAARPCHRMPHLRRGSGARLPAPGRTAALYREPSGPGIRVDSGVVEGDEVGVNYDPLLAKLIGPWRDTGHCHASARWARSAAIQSSARARMSRSSSGCSSSRLSAPGRCTPG